MRWSNNAGGNRLVLLGLWVIFYASFTLFVPPLLDDADSVHAEVAREMLARHDWVTLYANGIRYLEKAPLLYWSMAASFKVFGVSTASARLPLALAVLALALAMEDFGRRGLGSSRTGLYAGLMVLSSFGVFIFSRILIPDVMVCLWLTVAMLCFWRTEQEETPSRWLCWGFAACCALDVLTKGLIGIVFPVGIVAVYLVLTGRLSRLRQLHAASSSLVFLGLAVPWHVLIGLANPAFGHPGGMSFAQGHWSVPLPTDGNVHGWFWFYFVNEQLLRYMNLRVPRDYDTVPLWLFWGLMLVWLMPWSAFLFHGLGQVRWSKVNDAVGRTRLLLGVWAALPMLFFSFSTRQEYYVLPAIPALLLLIAGWLGEGVRKGSSPLNHERSGRRISAFLGAVGILVAVVCLFLVMHASRPMPGADLSKLLQQNPGEYALSFGHFLDLNAQAMGMFRLPLALTAAAFGLGLPAAFLLRGRGGARGANLVTAAAAFLFLVAAHLGLQTFSPVLSSWELARAISAEVRPDDLIAIHGEYESGSTLGFYLQRSDLHIVEGRSSNLWYGSFFPDAPKIFDSRESMAQRWEGPQRVFLWEDPHDGERPVLQLPGRVYIVASSGGKRILSNRPATTKGGG